MKTIKSLITFLLLTISVAVKAQTVVIEKTDGTSDEYEFSDIDSIAYEPEKVQSISSITNLNVNDEPSMTIGDNNIVVTSGTTILNFAFVNRVVLKALSVKQVNGDVNNDGKVDIQDVTALVKKILNKE